MIRVNGEPRPHTATNVAALVQELGLNAQQIAVAVNGTVVPRVTWSSRSLGPDDEVEIVGAVQGG